MTRDVRQWLEELELGQYGDAFVDNAIDIDLLVDLTDADLERLGKDTPDGRPVQSADGGKVVAFPQVGGLHHRYERLAA